jgi:lipoyl-dependent peroxiredoxin
MKRSAQAKWQGDLKSGTGTISTASGTLATTPYSFRSRFETSCTITLEQKDGGFAITESHLDLKAKVPGATTEAFEKATKAAETGCPVSKLFNTKITLDAHLEP